LRLKSAGEPSQRASQTFLFPTGGVYLKKSELILRAIGSAGGRAKTDLPSASLALKRKRKGRFQVFRSAFSGTLGFAQFGGKFFLNTFFNNFN
jgi:hypothetical protein